MEAVRLYRTSLERLEWDPLDFSSIFSVLLVQVASFKVLRGVLQGLTRRRLGWWIGLKNGTGARSRTKLS